LRPRWRNRYPAPVSRRFRQGLKTVSSRAEIIHHVAAAKADRGFKITQRPYASKRWAPSVGQRFRDTNSAASLEACRRNHGPMPALNRRRYPECMTVGTSTTATVGTIAIRIGPVFKESKRAFGTVLLEPHCPSDFRNRRMLMKWFLATACAAALSMASVASADAKGCIKEPLSAAWPDIWLTRKTWCGGRLRNWATKGTSWIQTTLTPEHRPRNKDLPFAKTSRTAHSGEIYEKSHLQGA